MAVDERKRHALYERLDEVLEDEHADTMMELLPPVGWADVATTQDLRLEVEALSSRMQSGFADLRTEMADLRTGLRTEMADLRSDLRTEMADLRGDLQRELRHQVWAILGVLIVALVIAEVVSRLG